MVDKMIQIDVDEMKEKFQKITSYYSELREGEKMIDSALDNIDDGKYISAHNKLLKVQKNMDSCFRAVLDLRTMLTDAGCVLD